MTAEQVLKRSVGAQPRAFLDKFDEKVSLGGGMARDTASGEKTIPFPSFVSPGLITTFRPVKSLNVACSSSPSSPPALNSFCLFPSTFSFFPSPFFPLLFFDVATILFRESRLTMIKRISEKDDKRTVYRRKTEQFLPEASEEM